jgi:membrane protein
MTPPPAEAWKRFVHSYQKEIWQPAHLKGHSPRGWFYAFLRVVAITWTVFLETKVPSRAAALSFSSLLGLGPLIAIAVLIGGFVLGGNSDPNLVANKLGQIIENIAPQLRQLESAGGKDRQPGPAASPEVVNLVKGIIAGARSGSAGVLGALSLILIVLLLFKSIDDAFNDIWGVHTGRSWLTRIFLYWTILTLGAVLFFAAVALLGAGTALNVFKGGVQRLPGGRGVLEALSWSLPLFSSLLLVALLTLFYRVVPNTRVHWRAAAAGAVVVAGFLTLNNYVALLYVRRVYLERSLYGSLGILPVLMLGLYVFWVYILIGGLISYAVQNVHFRNSQAAWSRLSEATRERLLLIVLLTICRRFQGCLPPVSASRLGVMTKVPTQILNECLNRLVDLRLVTPVPPPPHGPSETLYQPARPLNRITLHDFKQLDDNFGDDPIGDTLDRLDPVLRYYNSALDRLGEQPFLQKSVEELLAEHPLDESDPLFRPLAAP